MSAPARPRTLVAVLGTHTEVGKTYVGAALLRAWRAHGLRVAARKPVQSFDGGDAHTDADLLAGASAESSFEVCPAHRRYALPLAPPMAADALGAPRIVLADLLAELRWPVGVDVGLVETVGGPRSPLAHDADGIDLLGVLQPDAVLLVADAGLGTLNAVRLSLAAIALATQRPIRIVVLLNRFDAANDLHRRNLAWLREVDGVAAVTDVAAATHALLPDARPSPPATSPRS